MFGNKVDERIMFSEEDRKKILFKTKCRCASCGYKLTPETMTVDHAIPLSRGGKNEMRNLMPLCKSCNRMKSNKFFYPGDYYAWAMFECKPLVRDLHNYAQEWITANLDNFPLDKYPLVSPVSTFMINPGGMKIKKYMPQILYEVVYMSKDMLKAFSSRIPYDEGYTYYALFKRSSNSLRAIFRIQLDRHMRIDDVDEEFTQLTIYSAYVSSDMQREDLILRFMAEGVSLRLSRLGLVIDEVIMASENERTVNKIKIINDTWYQVNGYGRYIVVHGFGKLNGHVNEDKSTPFISLLLTEKYIKADDEHGCRCKVEENKK